MDYKHKNVMSQILKSIQSSQYPENMSANLPYDNDDDDNQVEAGQTNT